MCWCAIKKLLTHSLHGTHKLHGSICDRTGVIHDQSLRCGNRHFRPFLLLDLDLLTFIYKLYSYSLEIHQMCKYELPVWRLFKVISLSPVSPLDNIFALSAEVFSSCLVIVSAVIVGRLFLCPALRYGTGYQIVWEIRPSAETPSSVRWRRFYFQLTCVHSALELFGPFALQIYLLIVWQTNKTYKQNRPKL